MSVLPIIFESGEPDRVIEVDPVRAPFPHDGRSASILEVMLGHDVHLEHAGGGTCACATCHVIVRVGGDKLSPTEQNEEDLPRAAARASTRGSRARARPAPPHRFAP